MHTIFIRKMERLTRVMWGLDGGVISRKGGRDADEEKNEVGRHVEQTH